MRIKVLGAAAGGGFPQWNCNCAGCGRARRGDPAAPTRTQASLAVSADGIKWVLLNASPDLPSQLRRSEILHPDATAGPRHSPLAAVVISSGDIDCIAGLLSLRESQPFALLLPDYVRAILAENPVFGVLNPDFVPRTRLELHRPRPILGPDGSTTGLTLEAFEVPGKIPLYKEQGDDIAALASREAVIGLELRDAAQKRLLYIPACAALTPELRARIAGADILFFDGTLWRDDEMIRAGTGQKTGARMGHMSLSGPRGSLASLADCGAKQKIFIHINNTNPILRADSPEAAHVREAGWRIAHDGMELTP